MRTLIIGIILIVLFGFGCNDKYADEYKYAHEQDARFPVGGKVVYLGDTMICTDVNLNAYEGVWLTYKDELGEYQTLNARKELLKPVN